MAKKSYKELLAENKKLLATQKAKSVITATKEKPKSVLGSFVIIYEKATDSIRVTNIKGPLKHLENKWFFKRKGNNSQVDFHVNFELKNKILNLFMAKFFDVGLKNIADAFENRAIKLFKSPQN